MQLQFRILGWGTLSTTKARVSAWGTRPNTAIEVLTPEVKTATKSLEGIGYCPHFPGSLGRLALLQFSSVVSDSLWPHESQHARPPCPSQTPGVCSNSCPSSRWCHPAISSSVVPFSSCPQSLLASGSFPMSPMALFREPQSRASYSLESAWPILHY